MNESGNWFSLLSSKLKSCEKISKFASNTLNHFQPGYSMLCQSFSKKFLTAFVSMIEVFYKGNLIIDILAPLRK